MLSAQNKPFSSVGTFSAELFILLFVRLSVVLRGPVKRGVDPVILHHFFYMTGFIVHYVVAGTSACHNS